MSSKVVEFVHPLSGSLPHIPDDMTLPQFTFDAWHPTRPVNTHSNPIFIEDSSGREVHLPEIRARTFGLANEMKSRWNLTENEVVCIFSPNHVDYPICVWATHKLGATVTTANPDYSADELLYQLKLTKATTMFTCAAGLQAAEEACRNAGIPRDRIVVIDSRSTYFASFPTVGNLIELGLSKYTLFEERKLNPREAKTKVALLNFSSGTTGRPKAVAISHYAVIANVIQLAFYGQAKECYGPATRYRPGQCALAVLPFYHIYGLIIAMHFYVYTGFSLVVMPRFNLENMLQNIERYRINHLLLVPPMIVLLSKSPIVKQYDLTSVTFCMSGAAPLSAELTKQFCERLPGTGIGQGYGLTETATSFTFPRVDMKIGTLGSSGMLLPGHTARIRKPDGTWAGFNESGELYTKGPSMALYYLDNEEATKETFVYLDGKPDVWIRTGDEVMFNENMENFVLDRIKEIMKVKGFQVAPAELEGHLLEHPDVGDACVVGIPDDYSGEVPLAFIVPSHDAQERINKDPSEAEKIKQAVIKHVADHKVHYKRLAGGIVFVESIPKNPSGKLLRRFLRDKAKDMMKEKQLTKPKL